jgi:hypothetical protein
VFILSFGFGKSRFSDCERCDRNKTVSATIRHVCAINFEQHRLVCLILTFFLIMCVNLPCGIAQYTFAGLVVGLDVICVRVKSIMRVATLLC